MAHFFARTLLCWHNDNPRPLPWSDEDPDPYRIWLSEIIMQQTRIDQGADYYLRFVKFFPTLQSLSAASIDEVMRLWQGLGYYTRARNLHKAARYVVQNLDGRFPDTYDGLLALPGIGPYSAAAISSFAFGRRHVVVDGNVKRVVARFSGIYNSIDAAATFEQIREVATGFMKGVPPGLFNQAIMNFGALVCRPKRALCDSCPLSKKCYAFQHKMVGALPFRSMKKINKLRYFHFVVFHYRGKILLQRREGKDIWRGLYVPPLLERNSARIPSMAQIHSFFRKVIGHTNIEFVKSSSTIRQLLTHQTIIGRFLHVKLLSPPICLSEDYVWVSDITIHNYGKPKMIVQMLESHPGIKSTTRR